MRCPIELPFFLFSLAAAAFPVSGQSLSIGALGGVRVTNDFGGYLITSESRPYLVGPMVGFSLPLGFGIEFDALYQRTGYRADLGSCCASTFERERQNVWEFPLLVQYRIPNRVFKPFVEVGWAPRIGTSGSVFDIVVNSVVHTSYSIRTNTTWPTTYGVVAGGGVEINFGRLRLTPEVRYTHWNQPAIVLMYPENPNYPSSQNEMNILMGISWRIRESRR